MRCFLILLIFVVAVCFARTSEARKLALLVGVNEYDQVRSLRCCVNDMNTLGEALLKIGFKEDDIQVLTTGGPIQKMPTKEKIEQKVREILSEAQPSDMVFFAFSGHGMREDNIDYFCPPFADPDRIRETCVSITKVMDDLARSKARFKWMVVDACRNNPTNTREAKAFEVISSALPGIVLFQSCAKGEKSYEEERDGGNGYFTKNFAAALSGAADSNNDSQLTLLEVCAWTTAQTKADVKKAENAIQRPYLSGEISDFVLNGNEEPDSGIANPGEPALKITVPDDCLTIEEAYAKVKDGGIITIKPGKYELSQTLIVDRNVTFRGETSDPESVVIDCPNSSTVQITNRSPSFQNLTFSSGGTEEENRFGFHIKGGTPMLFRCIVTSREATGLVVEGIGTDPKVEKCIVKDCGRYGISVEEEARGTFRDCEIYENELAGVNVHDSGNPMVTRCKIHDGKDIGVLIFKEGRGEFTDCEIYGNAKSGIQVQTSGDPTFSRCKIHDGKANGMIVTHEGLGEFTDCEIYGNEYGIKVFNSGNPIVTRCKIHDGKDVGVFVSKNGLGEFIDCEIYGSEHSGIKVQESGNPTVSGCKIHDVGMNGVLITKEGLGTFTNCEIYRNAFPGIAVSESGNPTVTGCKIHDGKQGGIYIHDKGMGTFNNNILSDNYTDNKLDDWDIRSTAGEVKGSGNTPERPQR